METHISWVFIASPFVFKVKKTLSLGFLDFGTLEKRRHFCERELKLNRRLAPEIYLDVVPIYKSSSGFSFNEEGQVAEYAVKMKELPHAWSARRSLGEGGFLNELLEQNLVGEKEINRVITRLRQFYESEPPSAEIEEWGTPAKLKISTDENFIQVKPFVGKTISPAAFEAIRHFTNSFYAAKEKLFLERIQQHRIRDCHGDLHLDHIHITPETLSIFDCIEFNDRFRFIDIANDVAFLAMDFDFEGRSDLANLLLHNAAREFQDSGMLKVSDFYKCYRAFVRGKVQSIQGLSMKTTTPEEHANQSARYFRLALRYAVTGSEPLMLVITGRVATGNVCRTPTRNRIGVASLFLRPDSQNDGRPSTDRANATEAARRNLLGANDRTNLSKTFGARTGRASKSERRCSRRYVFEPGTPRIAARRMQQSERAMGNRRTRCRSCNDPGQTQGQRQKRRRNLRRAFGRFRKIERRLRTVDRTVGQPDESLSQRFRFRNGKDDPVPIG